MRIVRKIINSKFTERFKRQLALKTGVYFRIKKINPTVSEFMRVAKLLNHYKITKVLDVGANTGQFAESLIDFGYKKSIVSFEPVESARIQLLKRASNYSNWELAEKTAIGNFKGTVEINVSDETVYSSIKEIKSEYTKHTSVARTVHKETVPINKLDDLSTYYSEKDILFLKVDTQGFEKEVLEGAENLLKQVRGIMLEVPLSVEKEIYSGVEWDFKKYFEFLSEKGFQLVSVDPVSTNYQTGFVHEVDCVYMRVD